MLHEFFPLVHGSGPWTIIIHDGNRFPGSETQYKVLAQPEVGRKNWGTLWRSDFPSFLGSSFMLGKPSAWGTLGNSKIVESVMVGMWKVMGCHPPQLGWSNCPSWISEMCILFKSDFYDYGLYNIQPTSDFLKTAFLWTHSDKMVKSSEIIVDRLLWL